MNAPNKSGWKPEMQAAEGGFLGGPVTTTGNRALMLEEPLLFEIGRPDVTGVDLPEADASAPTRLGGLERADAIGLVGLTDLTGAPLLPTFVVRDPELGFRVAIESPIALDPQQSSDERTIAAATEYLRRSEAWVRRYPEQWRAWSKWRPRR